MGSTLSLDGYSDDKEYNLEVPAASYPKEKTSYEYLGDKIDVIRDFLGNASVQGAFATFLNSHFKFNSETKPNKLHVRTFEIAFGTFIITMLSFSCRRTHTQKQKKRTSMMASK